jgi:hypothetical protein
MANGPAIRASSGAELEADLCLVEALGGDASAGSSR